MICFFCVILCVMIIRCISNVWTLSMGCGHYLTVVVEEKRWAMSEMLSSHSPGDFRIVIGAVGGEEFSWAWVACR